ncbi:MAG: MarR family winged helix-turn-helix transcriptional regulator [Cyclobacteriaceae bacterium]
MIELKKDTISEFISALQGLVLSMQNVDATCMEAYEDVTKREFTLLIMLGKSEQMIMREIADFLQIPMSTATGIIDRLIEKDYVIRDYSSGDRRIVLVQLSKEGKSIYQTLTRKLYSFGKVALSNFSQKEKETFIRLMKKASSEIS